MTATHARENEEFLACPLKLYWLTFLAKKTNMKKMVDLYLYILHENKNTVLKKCFGANIWSKNIKKHRHGHFFYSCSLLVSLAENINNIKRCFKVTQTTGEH